MTDRPPPPPGKVGFRSRRAVESGAAAPPRRAIGYVRVSELGGRAGPELHTLEVQEESIVRTCTARGWELIDVLVETNRSGADTDRPLFAQARDRCLAGEADAFVVWKVSRFSRSLTHARAEIEQLRKHGVAFVAATEQFDTDAPQGELMMNLLLSFADYERIILGEQWENIKDRIIERGSHTGRTPYGYFRAKVEPKKPKDVSMDEAARLLKELNSDRQPVAGGLVPNPEEARRVRRVHEMRRAGESKASLVRWLDSEDPKGSGGGWRVNQVTRLLENKVYIGEIEHFDKEKRKKGVLELVRGNDDAHEPIVPLDLFQANQQPRHSYVRRSTKADFPLSGVLYCAGCGQKMAGQVRQQAGRVDQRVYRCGCQPRAACAGSSVIMAEMVEDLVLARAAPAYEGFVAEAHHSHEELAQRDHEVAQCQSAVDEMMHGAARDLWGRDYEKALRTRRRERDEAEQRRDTAYATAGQLDTSIQWSDLDRHEKFTALKQGVLSAVLVRRKQKGVPSAMRVWCFFYGDPAPQLEGSPAPVLHDWPAAPDADAGTGATQAGNGV